MMNPVKYADARDMYSVHTLNYRPPTFYKPAFLQMGLPAFTLETIEWMRRDPQVRLGMSIKLAPFHVVKLTIKADPEVAQYMGNQIRRFWMKAIPKITRAFWYTRSGGEIVYRNKNGQPEFWNYNDVYPSDIAILCKNRVPVGVSIKPQSGTNDPYAASNIGFSDNENPRYGEAEAQPTLRMFFPKGFLYLHGREFGSLQGQSEFEAAYESWMEKCDSQGAKHSRKLWFYKNAFSGGILFHPPGVYVDENNQEIPYQALARQAMETSLNGAIWTFEQKYDENGKPLWDYVQPQLNSGGEKILEYVRHLDNEIMRGLGIPDDIVQQITGTGSYAGRSIPLMSFFISQRQTLTNLFGICDDQVFRALCKTRFGHDNYEAMMEIDIDRLMGTMDGNPQQPVNNEHHIGNPHDTPGQPGSVTPNKISQFSEVPLVATVVRPEPGFSTTATLFNGVWDSSVRLILNPQDRAHSLIL